MAVRVLMLRIDGWVVNGENLVSQLLGTYIPEHCRTRRSPSTLSGLGHWMPGDIQFQSIEVEE